MGASPPVCLHSVSTVCNFGLRRQNSTRCSWLGPREYFILGFKRCLQVSFLKLAVQSVRGALGAVRQREHTAGRGDRVPEAWVGGASVRQRGSRPLGVSPGPRGLLGHSEGAGRGAADGTGSGDVRGQGSRLGTYRGPSAGPRTLPFPPRACGAQGRTVSCEQISDHCRKCGGR